MVVEIVLFNLKLLKIEDVDFLSYIVSKEEKIKLLYIVIFPSLSEELDIKDYYNLGANNYTQKSVDFNQLIEYVNRWD
ncbi:MAG: hypothetical protein ACFFD2_08420 [Promethearchaeota archaeon]